jgi:hypothetical protein
VIEHVHEKDRLTITLTGNSDIVRFALNMLDDQCEFSEVGRGVLVEIRERVGAKRFDEWVRPMLGAERFKKLTPFMRRDTHCVVCERRPVDRKVRLPLARVACRRCAS